ncbi:hypothetical protein ACFV4T_04395 [Streptomyces sp. NPDC059755]|uniref:hypothetical protein n=1 Tax=Streptomyces sp. NPDC059755 TaxID=3346934 RepID=UPI0036681C83
MFTRKRAVQLAVSGGLAATLVLGSSAGMALAQESPSDSPSSSCADPPSETEGQEHPPATSTEDDCTTSANDQTTNNDSVAPSDVPFVTISVPTNPNGHAEDALAERTFATIQCLNELNVIKDLAKQVLVTTGPLYGIIEQASRGLDINNDLELLAATGDAQYLKRLILDFLDRRECFTLLELTLSPAQAQ